MGVEQEDKPLAGLPAALVDEVLTQAAGAAGVLLQDLRHVRGQRAALRRALEDKGLLLHESDLGFPPVPTCCGADGSYAIERLLSADLAVAAAVAVEGLTPPSETRHWAEPHHVTVVEVEPHHGETATVLRALMLGHELDLAIRAPHDLVLLDMTLTLPLIYFNQALNQAPEAVQLRCSRTFLSQCAAFLEGYRAILTAQRSDKQYVGLPKYSTRRELGRMLGWPGDHDDRGLLTMVLKAGELTRPVRLEQPAQPWHLNIARATARQAEVSEDAARAVVEALGEVHVFYYKPHDWLPALRVEVGYQVAHNRHRLAAVVQGLKHQCAAPGMLEPYPLFLADRTVKAMARALPAFRQVAAQRVAEQYEGDIGEVYFAMHAYRSEAGR